MPKFDSSTIHKSCLSDLIKQIYSEQKNPSKNWNFQIQLFGQKRWKKRYLNRRSSGLEQQGIGLVSKNRRFSPQTAQSTAARIQIVQIIRDPSPTFDQNTDVLHFQLTAFSFRLTTKLLQRRRRRPIWDKPFVFLLEPSATHLRVPLLEGAEQMGKWVRPGFDPWRSRRRSRSGLVDVLNGVGYRWEVKEAREEEDQESEAQHGWDGEDVEGLQWHGTSKRERERERERRGWVNEFDVCMNWRFKSGSQLHK